MPSYKLIYFNGTGRAEAARMLFALAGQEFEDVRLSKEEFEKMKDSTPLGQLPVLEVDGEMFAQSNAIYRLLAKRFGLDGENDREQAKGDMIVDTFTDIVASMTHMYDIKDETLKAELKQKFENETLPGTLDKLENLVASEFFLSKLTWVESRIAEYIKNRPSS